MQRESNRALLGLAAAFIAAAVPDASAVTLNARGEGQALLFSYYTARANNNTLLSLVNATESGKALRVRFAEGENGRDSFSLNVYLSAYDTWTAAIGQSAGSSVATLVSNDASCTVPAIPAGGAQFSNAAFSGAAADPGDAGPSRTLEGSIEVFEMGTIVRYSATEQALGKNCEFLIEGWSPPGFFVSADNQAPHFWYLNPTADLLNPTGGLYGSAYVVDVEQGTIFAYDAAALGGFRVDPLDQPRGSKASVVLHTAPGSAHPNLADALSDPAAGIAVAEVQAGDRSFTTSYPAATRGVDAVSAVLMASTLANDYEADPGAGATTSFVFNYPTRRFYTDPAIAGTQAILPFTTLFAGIQHDTPAEIVGAYAFDREAGTRLHSSCPAFGCPDPINSPGTAVEVLNFGAGADAILGSALSMSFAPYLGSPAPIGTAGWLILSLDIPPVYPLENNPDTAPRGMRPSREGRYFSGLPVLGFGVQNLVNGNVRNGILANYTSALTHRVTANCLLATADVPQRADGPCP